MLNFGDREREIRQLERELSVNMVLLSQHEKHSKTNDKIKKEVDRLISRLSELYYGLK